jgi:hypothetical protein
MNIPQASSRPNLTSQIMPIQSSMFHFVVGKSTLDKYEIYNNYKSMIKMNEKYN